MGWSLKWNSALASAAIVCAVATSVEAGTVTYTYDALGRLIGTTNSNGLSTTYTYDPAGNRTAQTVSAPQPNANGFGQQIALNAQGDAIDLIDKNGIPRYSNAASLAITAGPSHGTATVVGLKIFYTPNTGYSGSDSLSYQAVNAIGWQSASAVVNLSITASVGTIPIIFGSSILAKDF